MEHHLHEVGAMEHHLHGFGEHEPIPGERDSTNLTQREPGAIGGQFSGADTPSPDTRSWMDRETAHEHEHEGGGAEKDRRRCQGTAQGSRLKAQTWNLDLGT